MNTCLIVGHESKKGFSALQIKNDFGFHPFLQTWVIGKRLARDTDTLFNHGVSKDGDRAFLFIKAAKAAHLSREQQKQEAQHQRLDGKIDVTAMHAWK